MKGSFLLLLLFLVLGGRVHAVGEPEGVSSSAMHALGDVALASLLSLGSVCRIRSLRSGSFISHKHFNNANESLSKVGSLKLDNSGHTPFWLHAIDSEASKLIDRAGSGWQARNDEAEPIPVACHLCPITPGLSCKYVSLQQAQPMLTSNVAASLAIVPMRNRPWVQLQSASQDSARRKVLATGKEDQLEIKVIEKGGNIFQKAVRMLASGQQTAFEIEVLESSLSGQTKWAGAHLSGQWLPLWDACVLALQTGLGVDLAVSPVKGMANKSELLYVSPAGRLRRGCRGEGGASDTSISFGSAKVKKVMIETFLPFHSRGNLKALLATVLGPAGTRANKGRGRGPREDRPSESPEVSAVDLHRYVEIEEEDLDPGFQVRLARHVAHPHSWRVLVDAKSLRAGLSLHVSRRRASFMSAVAGAGGLASMERLSRQLDQTAVSGGSTGKKESRKGSKQEGGARQLKGNAVAEAVNEGRKTRRARGKKAMKQAIQAAELKGTKKPAQRTEMGKGPQQEGLPHGGEETQSGRKQEHGNAVRGDGKAEAGLKAEVGERGGKLLCDGCGEQLSSSKVAGAGDKVRFTFREHGGNRYCDKCYAMNFAPSCARCHHAIIDTITSAMGKNWHPACLTCALCNAQLQSTFYLQDHKPGVPYCSFCIKGVEQTARNQRAAGAAGGGFGSLGPMTWPAQPRASQPGPARMQNFQ